MALASTLHGTKALDRKLRTSYVPGNSGSDQSTTRGLSPAASSRRLLEQSSARFEGTDLQPRAHYFVE